MFLADLALKLVIGFLGSIRELVVLAFFAGQMGVVYHVRLSPPSSTRFSSFL